MSTVTLHTCACGGRVNYCPTALSQGFTCTRFFFLLGLRLFLNITNQVWVIPWALWCFYSIFSHSRIFGHCWESSAFGRHFVITTWRPFINLMSQTALLKGFTYTDFYSAWFAVAFVTNQVEMKGTEVQTLSVPGSRYKLWLDSCWLMAMHLAMLCLLSRPHTLVNIQFTYMHQQNLASQSTYNVSYAYAH